MKVPLSLQYAYMREIATNMYAEEI